MNIEKLRDGLLLCTIAFSFTAGCFHTSVILEGILFGLTILPIPIIFFISMFVFSKLIKNQKEKEEKKNVSKQN